MANELRILGVIGARSGSRGLPGKNIRPIGGKPLFAWVAEAAQGSKYPIRLIMSTDSEAYAALAKEHGIEVPFLRPVALSGGEVPDFDYLYHAAREMDSADWRPDIILRLPPTSPLLTSAHIDECVQLLIDDEKADSSRTIAPAPKHPYKLWRTEGEYLVPFLSEEQTGIKDAHNQPRQSFPPVFAHAGVIALRWKTLVEDKAMAGEKVRYHIIPKEEAVDIDTELDFLIAEELLKRRHQDSESQT